MDNLDVLSSGESISPDPSENIDESVFESDAAFESDVASESDAASGEEPALASDQVGADLEPIVSVLDEIQSEVVTVNEALITCNGLLLALLFFMVAQWVVSKVKGSVERMLNWKI